MRFYLLLLLVTGGAYAIASLSSATVVTAVWPTVRARALRRTAGERARVVAAWRLGPPAVGAAVALAVAAAFWRFEPRHTTEDPGVLLLVAAATTLLLVVQAARRLSRALRSGLECARLVRTCGRRVARSDGAPIWFIETDYPVAAVVGVVRTRLLVSTRIVQECTPGELDAVLRHEQAHVNRRDNLVRAAMLALPNPLSLTRTGREMDACWSAAAEESADDQAAGHEPGARATLASALVRVARMAQTPAPPWMPALAFYEGTNLEHRVRRLLVAGALSRRAPLRSMCFVAAGVAACALALTETVALHLHLWMEMAVNLAP
jgi:Zn-dependent protease with chaperone function